MPDSTLQSILARLEPLVLESAIDEDRSGRNELDQFASEVSADGIASPSSIQAGDAASALLERSSQFTSQQLQRLTFFILAARLPADRLQNTLERTLNLGQINSDQRAELLRLYARLGRKFLPSELDAETSVKNAQPWVWFDVTLASAPKKALGFILERAKEHGVEPALVARFIELWRNLEQEDFTDLCCELRLALSTSQYGVLQEALAAYEIEIPGRKDKTSKTNGADAEEFGEVLAKFKQDLVLDNELAA